MKIIYHNDLKPESVSHNPEINKQVILRNGDAQNITQVSKTTFSPGQATDTHTHMDMTEIYTIHTGEAEFTIDDSTSTVTAPATVLIHPGELHSLANHTKEDVVLNYIGILAPEIS